MFSVKMPSGKVHDYVCKKVLGESYAEVNRMIDKPVVIMGKKHREYFHDPLQAMAVGMAIGGNKGATAALLHLLTDKALSADSKSKKIFEAMSRRAVKKA